jgi:hypothetical protein
MAGRHRRHDARPRIPERHRSCPLVVLDALMSESVAQCHVGLYPAPRGMRLLAATLSNVLQDAAR